MITIIAIAGITSVGVFRLKMEQKQLYSITATLNWLKTWTMDYSRFLQGTKAMPRQKCCGRAFLYCWQCTGGRLS